MTLRFLIAAAAMSNVAIFHPVAASANGRFVTVEVTYADAEGLVVGSLRATEEDAPVDGQITFEGFAIAQGRQVPWSVTLPTETPQPDVASVVMGGGSVNPIASYSFKSGDIAIEKTFFDVKGEEVRGVMTLTDDPLPLAVWIVIAGASAILVPLGVYVAKGCEKISTKTTITKDSVSYETSCEGK